jgi:hypothetical protein
MAGNLSANVASVGILTGAVTANTLTVDTLSGPLIGNAGVVSAATTGNLTASSPLSVSQTRQLLGGAAVLSVDTSNLLAQITTGTVSATTPLTVTAGRYVLGGALALDIDTSNLVPYVGATTNVNLGLRELSTDGSLKVKGSSIDRAGVEIFYNTSTSRGTIISVDRASGTTNGLYIASNTLILGCSGGTAFIGNAVNGIDYALVFSGNANTGKIQWMEDENYFDIPQVISATAVTATALTYINAVGTQTMNTTVPQWWISGRFRSGTTGATPTDGTSLEIYYSGLFDRGVMRTVDRAGSGTDKPLQLWGSWIQLNATGGTAYIGSGGNYDLSLVFTANASVGIINFMENEDRFDIPDTINATDGLTANLLTVGTLSGPLTGTAGQVTALTTGNLTAAAPVTLSATRQLLGGAAVISVDTSNYLGQAYYGSFGSANVAGGTINIAHNMSNQYLVPVIYNSANSVVIPDSFVAVSTANMAVGLSSYGTLTGIWHYSLLGVGAVSAFPTKIQDGGATTYVDTTTSANAIISLISFLTESEYGSIKESILLAIAESSLDT